MKSKYELGVRFSNDSVHYQWSLAWLDTFEEMVSRIESNSQTKLNKDQIKSLKEHKSCDVFLKDIGVTATYSYCRGF